MAGRDAEAFDGLTSAPLPQAPQTPDEAYWRTVRARFLLPKELAFFNAANLCPASLASIEAHERNLRQYEADPSPAFRDGLFKQRELAHDPIPDRSERVRTCLFPNPEHGGAHQDYYAFEWGDVLVVVLDPYRYTMRKPHSVGDGTASRDPWDWSLGQEQANWLADTLARSDAPFKLVFAHQVVGGPSNYGRGGRMALGRVLRCRPGGGAGSDPVPKAGTHS